MTTTAMTICTTSQRLFRGARNRGFVDVGVATSHGLWCKSRERVHPCRGSQRSTAVRQREQRDGGGGGPQRIELADENTGATVLHDVRQTAGLEGDDRRLTQ